MTQIWTAKSTVLKRRGHADVNPAGFILGTTKPDSTNTGVPSGTTLTTVTSTMTYSTPGQTISNMYFKNFVYARADSITFRNCIFEGPNSNGFVTYGLLDCRDASATNVLVDQCTFAGIAKGMYWCNAVSIRSGASVTVQRCDISACADGLNVSGASLNAYGNYIHDQYFFNNSADHASDATHPYWEHCDGIQISGGSGPFNIQGNNFQGYMQLGTDDGIHGLPRTDPQTGSWDRRGSVAGITCSPDNGTITGVSITYNWFDGSVANFQCNSAAEQGNTLGTIGYNRFGMDQYEYTSPGSGDRYQIRFNNGITINSLTTNYFDPNDSSVPAQYQGVNFTYATNGGIRLN